MTSQRNSKWKIAFSELQFYSLDFFSLGAKKSFDSDSDSDDHEEEFYWTEIEVNVATSVENQSLDSYSLSQPPVTNREYSTSRQCLLGTRGWWGNMHSSGVNWILLKRESQLNLILYLPTIFQLGQCVYNHKK